MPVSDFNILLVFPLSHCYYMYIYVFFLLYCFMCICSHGNNHYNNLCLNTRVCGKYINTSLAIPHNELMILNSGNNFFLCLWINPMQFIIAIYVNVILIHWPGMNITRLVSHALSIYYLLITLMNQISNLY